MRKFTLSKLSQPHFHLCGVVELISMQNKLTNLDPIHLEFMIVPLHSYETNQTKKKKQAAGRDEYHCTQLQWNKGWQSQERQKSATEVIGDYRNMFSNDEIRIIHIT